MSKAGYSNDFVHFYMNELTSRIVASSGIPSDRFHLGKIILQSLRDNSDLVLHIDGATGESETYGAGLKRSVQCANAFRKLDLVEGDVIAILGPNHIDVAIPFLAALYVGVASAPINIDLNIKELQESFILVEPKIIFTQNEKVQEIKEVLRQTGIEARLVTFDKGDHELNFEEFLHRYGEDVAMDDFRATDFDPEKTAACLMPTSGTTGSPKAAVATHKNFVTTGPYLWIKYFKFPTPTRMLLLLAPMQWISSIANCFIAIYMKYPRLQSSLPPTREHVYDLINKYKPTYTLGSSTMLTTLLKCEERIKCDFSCLETVLIGGSTVHKDLIEEVESVTAGADVVNCYGLTETTMAVFSGHLSTSASLGTHLGCFEYKLVDVNTESDVNTPYAHGELWLRGPGVIKEYYRNPRATKDAFTTDSWFKTGDLMYRDERYYYYFVDRIKMMLKYKSYQISPTELESVIRGHPDIVDVAVTGTPDPESGDLPTACVIARPGSVVTEEQISDIVKDSLSDFKQLRGGVIFMKEFPTTKTTKLDRRRLKEIVLEIKKSVQ